MKRNFGISCIRLVSSVAHINDTKEQFFKSGIDDTRKFKKIMILNLDAVIIT